MTNKTICKMKETINQKLGGGCCKMKTSTIFLIGIVLVILVLIAYPAITGKVVLEEREIKISFDEEVIFHKSLSCGCCDLHSSYLSANGKLNVQNNVISDSELSEIKNNYRIPSELQSCHTVLFGEYFVEGHVPLEALEKLLEEKPDILGISLPGMPTGSPGMPGRKMQEFVVYAINHDGTYEEFMRI